ncbi:MAG: AmmeMemoRadiSam system radical SAM enzyme [Desulfobacterales bacterium]|nr:AmmeMemoRadiSam system radical SAM enzyme [Desulfobacterales bacterium]
MEALLYEKAESEVKCNLCNHFCKIPESKRGICGVRENRSGILHTLVYDKVITTNVDPIEKKPLYHFYPGSLSYSIATPGCNFRCRFCQNHHIAQIVQDRGLIVGEAISPEKIVADAKRSSCRSISYTYTEPTIYFELAYETSKLAYENNIKNVFVTNGYMSKDALDMIFPYLDAANVDLKSFSNDFYKKYCGAKLSPVLDNLIYMKENDLLVEVTTLIIPGLNDSIDELDSITDFIHTKLGAETPWHISRFHPTYKLNDNSPTDPEFLLRTRERIMKKGLKYVYTGNILSSVGSGTICSGCSKTIIERDGYRVKQNDIKNGNCSCGCKIYGSV